MITMYEIHFVLAHYDYPVLHIKWYQKENAFRATPNFKELGHKIFLQNSLDQQFARFTPMNIPHNVTIH